MRPAHSRTPTSTTSIASWTASVDTPSEAHFLSTDVAGESRLLKDADLLESLWLFAQAQLRREGKLQLCWLSGRDNGYEPVPADSTPLE